MRFRNLIGLLLFIFSHCSPAPRKVLTNYVADLQSGKTPAWKELLVNGRPLPFLLGPPNPARDHAFQTIVSSARIQIEGEEIREDHCVFQVKVDAIDTERLTGDTLIHSAIMKRMAGPQVTPQLMNMAVFLEMERLAKQSDAARSTRTVSVRLNRGPNGWVVEKNPDFIGALFGFQSEKKGEQLGKTR